MKLALPRASAGTVFAPVRSQTAFEETLERLGTAIKLGLLEPGARLPAERELCRQLGISRSTLRQAILTLVQSGHLLSLRGRAGGTFVSDEPPLATDEVDKPSAEAMRAILDYRVAIETGAAMLAAERARDRDIARMQSCVDKMASAQRFDTYRRADMRFHVAVAEAARSPRLVAAMTEVQADIGQLISLIAHPETVLTRSNAQHGKLVAALERGDATRAVRLTREHLAGTEHIIAGLMPVGWDAKL